MMAWRRRYWSENLGQIDITQPIDISSTLQTYSPTSAAADTMLPPPPVLPASGFPAAALTSPAISAQMQAEGLTAQESALRQGFLSPQTAALWLQQNAGLVIGGVAVIGLFMMFGGRKRR